MSHRPLIISLQVKTKILLTTVAGRSFMDDLTAEGLKHAHRNGFIYRFRRHRRGCHRQSLREEPGCSIRPVHESGSIETRGHDDSHQLHPWIEPTPRNDKGLAFTYGRHSETHNYRSACARAGLAAPRRPSLVVQKI